MSWKSIWKQSGDGAEDVTFTDVWGYTHTDERKPIELPSLGRPGPSRSDRRKLADFTGTTEIPRRTSSNAKKRSRKTSTIRPSR